MILQTVALLQSHPKPTEAQIVEGLNGNLCRCSGHLRVLAAVRRAAAAAEQKS
jgi:aerobic-type carbon monoxide dehydrogenase small subunit (CoxS/CutS family)